MKKLVKLAGVAALGILGVALLTSRVEAPEGAEVLSEFPQEVVENVVVEETTVEDVVENTTEKASVKTTAECPAEEKLDVTIESSTKPAETSAVVEAPAEIVVEDNSKELNDTAKAVEEAQNNRIYSNKFRLWNYSNSGKQKRRA